MDQPAHDSDPGYSHQQPFALPEQVAQLKRLIAEGSAAQVVRALCVAAQLGLVLQLGESTWACCEHPDAKVRSKAVLMLGDLIAIGHDLEATRRLEAAVIDADDRVRANAIEVLERTGRRELGAMLESRSRLGRNRERANAIKALATLGLCDPNRALFDMLRDRRDAHRLSALWAVERTGHWKLIEEIARMARDDSNVRVRQAAIVGVQRIAQRMRAGANRDAAARTAA